MTENEKLIGELRKEANRFGCRPATRTTLLAAADSLELQRGIERRLSEAPVRTVGDCCGHLHVEREVANAEEDTDVRQMVGQRVALVRLE